MYLIKLCCYVDSYCCIFEDQESDYSRGRFFSDPYSSMRFSEGLEVCAYCTTKGLGPSTACNLGVSRWGQYSSYTVFFIWQLFNVLGCLFIIIQFLDCIRKSFQAALLVSPNMQQMSTVQHAALTLEELVVKTGREPTTRRELTHPKLGARPWSRAALSWLLSQCPSDQTTPPLQGVWSVIMKDHVALVSFTVRAA